MWIAFVVGSLALMMFYDYFLLKKSSGGVRIVLLCALIIAALVWPFLAPNLPILRFVMAMIAFNKIIKSVEIAYGRVYDEKMTRSFGRYLFWSTNFPDTVWPDTGENAKKVRRAGLGRMLRSLPKLALAAALFALSTKIPWIHSYYWLTMLWLSIMAYGIFSGTFDMVSGTCMLTGIELREMMNAPFLARSPREFWGKRWNLYFRDVAHRNVFLPLGGAKRALLSVCLVFALSAILHEYLIFASVGFKKIGWMTAFFTLHCLATIAQTSLAHKTGKKKFMPPPLAIALNWLWMIATVPLLMEPMLLVFPIIGLHFW